MTKLKSFFLFAFFSLLFYGASLRFGFSQDDFYFLKISDGHSLLDVLKFFSPWHQQGFPFYRPLGTQLYFYLFKSFWEPLAPLAMHIFMLIVQAFSGYQVFLLSQKLVKDRTVPYLVGLSYTAGAAHFLSLFYIAATQQLLMAGFSLLSLNRFLTKRSRAAAIFLALALLSKESAIVVPAIAFLLYFFHQKGSLRLKKLFPVFTPYLVIVACYLLLRYLSGITVQAEYHPVLNLSLVSSLRWYYLFTFNAPELLLNYAGSNLFVNYFRFIKDFGYLAIANSLSSLILAFVTLGILIRALSKRELLLYFQWWLLGIVLVIAFPWHRYPHYLDLALPALLIPLYLSLKGNWRYLLFGLYLVGAGSGIALSISTHWTTGRAQMAGRATAYFDSHNLCQHDSIYFVGDPAARELSYTLSLENGPQVICARPELKVYYQGVTDPPPAPAVTVDARELVRKP